MMTMGNSVPRAGIEPTSLSLRANVLTVTHARLPDITMRPKPACVCGFLSERAVQTATIAYEFSCYIKGVFSICRWVLSDLTRQE